MPRPAAQEQDPDQLAGPAIITPLHVQDRHLSKVAGTPRGWRKRTPLEAYYDQGKLEGGNGKYDARTRKEAGTAYTALWDTAQSAGRDSTQAINLSRGTGGAGISHSQSDAIRSLIAVESHLGQRDRAIIRSVCGCGDEPHEAIAKISPDYTKATSARFRESLDALADALAAVRLRPGRMDMRVI